MRPPTRAEGLREGRLHLHYAAQTLSALGASLRPKQSDGSHATLEIHAGRLHVSGAGIDASLDGSGALMIARGGNARTVPLPGCTLDEVLGELPKVLQMLGVRDPKPVPRLVHALPEHPLATEPFGGLPIESDIVLRWLAFGWEALSAIEPRPGLQPVRLWPHHFDAARLWQLGATQGVGLGFGFSPGDAAYDEPYFYVSLGRDTEAHLPDPIEGGHWHRDGWTGAVLLGSSVIAGADVSAFLLDAATKGKDALIS